MTEELAIRGRVGEPGNSIGKQFQKGNLASLKHGAQSNTVLSSLLPVATEEIRQALQESLPALTPVDDLVLERLARCVTALRRMDEKIDDLGGSWMDSRGRPRAFWRLYSAKMTEFRALCGMMGISPASRAAVMKIAGAGQKDYEASIAARELRERYARPALPEAEVIDE